MVLSLESFSSNVITSLTFSVIIIACLLGLFFCKGENQREFRELIGGLSVLLVALVADHIWVYVPALIIGGLIIATEGFMKFLAAILTSSSDKVPDAIKAMKEYDNKIDESIREEVSNLNVDIGQSESDSGDES